ncbi:MAG: 2-succinyl-5-enolpyruvyl-6-hydroxy-3-cyclohexene-1-carboxylic-acid synthase [Longimicrobiales bacterium]|nr:2-succinyl-5-enolpyruvyl-6-hydroxy-3-cyclohexene-1-carboxylic-acid synthase [Longimicrobiales bacterium]
MTGSVTNTLWARSFVDELARAGVCEIVIAPGSRSTPLVMACAADDRMRTRVHLDERSAAFFALGVGKASGQPAAVITTSGTAVANVFPAVVEASQAGVPLLVLTADRPHRLRGADANQAIDQVGIFGGYVRAFFEMAPPEDDPRALRHLRSVASRAVADSVGPSAGPVQVNFPFDKPLEPIDLDDTPSEGDPVPLHGRESRTPFTRIQGGRTQLSDTQIDQMVDLLGSGHGVIVAGPSEDTGRVGAAVRHMGAATGCPVLADALSGARFGPSNGAVIVAGYDIVLGDETARARLRPSVILRIGTSPTSAALQRWMAEHHDVPQLVIDEGPRWKDHASTATHYFQADPSDTLVRLADRAPRAEKEWTELWLAVDRAVRTSEVPVGAGPHEGDVLTAALAALPTDGGLFVSSSMPIRDLDTFAHPAERSARVFANRGASGIDGVVSSAFGAASQCDGVSICVIGDVAFFHDQNGLLWSREKDAPVVFVVIDNDGGGIFHMLPIAEHDPHFTRFFATPHGVHPRYAAEAHGIGAADVTIEDLPRALDEAVRAGETTLLRVVTERTTNHARRAAAKAAVRRSAIAALG